MFLPTNLQNLIESSLKHTKEIFGYLIQFDRRKSVCVGDLERQLASSKPQQTCSHLKKTCNFFLLSFISHTGWRGCRIHLKTSPNYGIQTISTPLIYSIIKYVLSTLMFINYAKLYTIVKIQIS